MPFEEKSFSGCQIIDDNSNNTVKAISGLSTERGISVCEAANLKRGGQGRNANQQDAFFVGTVEADVASNPEKSFAESLKPIIEKYDNFECGTTLCSAIATPDGKGGVNITTANLGDSRAAVVVKYLHKDSNGDEKIGYRSILLTEDMSPKTKRFANQVIEKGGIIYGDRVNGDSATAGSIGDSDIKGLNKESALIRNPEVWQINSERFFSSSQETLLELDLIVSCDGLWEYNLTCDFSYYKEKSTDTDIKFRELNASSEKRLSNLKKTYDKQTESEKQKQSFADYLVAHALKSGSRDNITAISVPLISETEGVLIENGSGGIIATVCDGHGKGANKEIQEGREDGFYFRGIKYNSREEAETEADKKATEEASSEANTQAETFRKKDLSIEIEEVKDGISSKDDGCLVASSVAADVFTALKVKEIKGLEISDKHQEPLAQIIKKRNPSRSSNDSSKTANNNQKTREEILRDVTSDHLPQRFTIETQKGSKINIATWNVLQQCQSKAKSGTGYSNNPWDFDEGIKAFEKRREKQLETFDELSGCGIICLQEFSEKDPERQGRIYNILARLAARGGNWNVIDPTKTTDLGDAKNGNIIFYREDKFDVKDRTPSILSPNKNNGSEGIYLGLDVTFRDKKTKEDFIVTNVHGAFGKSDLIQNHCDSLAANSTPAIIVGDFNCHSKELRTKISTDDKIKDSTKVLASDLATNFDTLNAGDRAENAVMNTENKCYDYAVVVDKQYNFKSCEIEAQSFSDKLKNAKNFSSIPLHETEARKCFLGVVQEIFKNPRPDKQTRARLRNIFANSALPDFLREEIVSGKLQMDGAEFLTSALDGITPEKIITDTNEVSWERGEKTSTKSEDHTKLELPFPDKVRDTSCSKMLNFYQQDSQLEGDNKYQSKSGLVDATSKRKITVKADPAHELIVSVKRVYTTGRDASYRRHRASSKVIADSIEIETTSGGKQKYEATAFLVHRGNTPDAGHYVTYIKELVTNKNGSEKVVWALYNDSDRTEIDDSELLNGLPPESVNAYNIKYSPLVDGANDSVTGKARYKTGLPKSQENGTANGGNRCWANAAFAFALSLNSFYDSELDKTSSEVPLTSSQETTPTDTDLNSLIIDDLKGKDSEVLKFFQDLRSKDESEQKKINEDLEQFGYSEKILIGNAVTRFLSTLDTDYKSSDQIWNCLETLSNPKNLEKTIGLISSMDHSSFTDDPEKYLKDNEFETETNSSSISLTEFFIKKLDSEPDSNTFFELLPDAIKIGGADFLADILCHVTSNQNDEVKNRLISEFKADRNKKSQFHKNRSAAEIEAEIGAGLNKRNQPSYSGIRNDTSFTKKSIEATSDANYAIDDSKIEKVDQTNGLNEIRSQLDKISKKPETDKNSKEFYEKSLKPNSLKTVDKNLRIFDEAQIEELEKLKYTDDKKNKTSQKLWYSEFAGIEFRPPNSIDLSSMFATSDEDRGKADLFAGADLFMASFRNCVFENVDLSEVKNLETVGFYNCTFRNCKFSEKFLESIKMHNSENLKIENSEFSIKKLSPIPSNSPRPSLAKVLKAESLHKILSKS